MLRAKRLERAPCRLRHSRLLHQRCDGGPLVSRWDAFFVVGTADTKGEELAYLRVAVVEAGCTAIVVDLGIGPPRCGVDIAKCGYQQTAWHTEIVQIEIERGLASDAIGCVRGFSLQDGGICANSCWRSPALISPSHATSLYRRCH